MSAVLSQLLLTLAHRPAPPATRAELAALEAQVQSGALEALDAPAGWALLASLLLAPHPAQALRALRRAGGLRRWLPELDALFGVPQLSDAPWAIDVGEHVLAAVGEAAHTEAPLAVRLAVLAQPLGKGGTPREIWPHHVGHERRGQAVLDAWATRLALPADALDLARLAVDELDRVHRVADVRAGPIAEMLERLQAREQPERFERLLQACTLDFAAYPGHTAADYAKAARLRRAAAACRQADAAGPVADADTARERRAQAVARALGSTAGLAR